MFQTTQKRTPTRSILAILELIYHSTVRNIRKTHRNALAGLVMNIIQTIVFIAAFFLMFNILGMRGNAIRGDFMLYLMSGIFLFLLHTKTMGAVVKAEGPTSAMMQHAPLNTLITICAAALGTLYLQLLSLFVVLFFYHVLFAPITIDDPVGAMEMVLLAWLSGVGVGVVFLSIKPWAPEFVTIAASIYSRANMIASGKMFVANSLPGYMLVMFDWNPLFHAIDQCRGYVFLNYNPHFSSPTYPLYIAIGLIVLGLMGEYYTRRHASVSWGATR
ncbi:ABC transporter permease [Flavimaricola marinus]|uniref:ABC-2 type transporter n=1 Tax=Flavimaricola marinus TaxID=1819565 RepID=A0A238LBU5_9RHOB|nr:ABC transporter permease [Flavimaricola marinus]SMY07108.1 ABC-2 type transporter [Flavimaricola marinus]